MKKILLILLAPFFIISAFAGQGTALNYKELEKDILNRTRIIKSITKSSDYIVDLSKSLKDDDGNSTWGVYLVETKDGPAAMKIYLDTGSLTKNSPSIIMQRYLSKVGYAPAVMGVMEKEELTKVLQKNPITNKKINDGSSSYSFAFIMEVVPGAWNFMRSHRVAKNLQSWDPNSIKEQMSEISSMLDKLRIMVNDFQIVISDEGRVKLLDIDKYFFVTKKNHFIGWVDDSIMQESMAIDGKFPISFKKPIPFSNNEEFDTALDVFLKIFIENVTQ